MPGPIFVNPIVFTAAVGRIASARREAKKEANAIAREHERERRVHVVLSKREIARRLITMLGAAGRRLTPA